MPGNPLPVDIINLEDRGWPYDSGTWGDIPVTAGPKSIIDASDMEPTLEQSRGIISFMPNASNMPNEEIPNTGGERGFLFRHQGKASVYDDNSREARYTILSPSAHIFERIKMYQPTNYFLPERMDIEIADLSSVANWVIGDTVTSDAGQTAEIIEIGDESGSPTIALTNHSSQYTFWNGKTITNDRNSESVLATGSGLIASNNKTTLIWVDDGGSGNGYSNGAYGVEVDAKDFTGTGYLKFQVSSSNYATNSGTQDNQLSGGLEYVPIFDVADNGSFIDLCIERKRSDSQNPNTGECRIWKKTYRVGGDYPEWTLIYENTSLKGYTEPEPNVFTHGYIMGAANSGYLEDTDFYLQRHELWLQKPTFLP